MNTTKTTMNLLDLPEDILIVIINLSTNPKYVLWIGDLVKWTLVSKLTCKLCFKHYRIQLTARLYNIIVNKMKIVEVNEWKELKLLASQLTMPIVSAKFEYVKLTGDQPVANVPTMMIDCEIDVLFIENMSYEADIILANNIVKELHIYFDHQHGTMNVTVHKPRQPIKILQIYIANCISEGRPKTVKLIDNKMISLVGITASAASGYCNEPNAFCPLKVIVNDIKHAQCVTAYQRNTIIGKNIKVMVTDNKTAVLIYKCHSLEVEYF